jgi:ubiquinone/menaquinone biosynthesis C-methylase UbiE
MKIRKIITTNHLKTKREYLPRMNDNKIACMKIARKFDFNYWDGDRKFGYGGYKYISGHWSGVAKKIIKAYNLNSKSKILDAGCGKGFLLYEIKKIIPDIEVVGFDISKYAIKNSKKEIKPFLYVHSLEKKTKFSSKYFDLVVSIGCLHNLYIFNLERAINEINRISKKSYIMVESYTALRQLFNLQCWALTANIFLSSKEWIYLLKKFNFKGDLEFIYFN